MQGIDSLVPFTSWALLVISFFLLRFVGFVVGKKRSDLTTRSQMLAFGASMQQHFVRLIEVSVLLFDGDSHLGKLMELIYWLLDQISSL